MINVMILFGGNSPEHEVSLRSASTVYSRLDRRLFQPIPVGITRDGRFYRTAPPEDGQPFSLAKEKLIGEPLSFTPGKEIVVDNEKIDFVFPIAHGAFGEDGRLQGFLEMLGVPYAGCRTVGSAVCMDKDLTKRLCAAAGIPVVPSETIRCAEEASAAAARIGFPLVIKPANAGSSVGVSRAENRDELNGAIDLALAHDQKLVFESAVDGQEVECAVIGSEPSAVSTRPGEILAGAEFYTYDDKYKNGVSQVVIPARLSEEKLDEVKELARKAYTALGCEGLARCDFFVERGSGRVLCNELNTMPGFTAISMYPTLWEARGVTKAQLIQKLIDSAKERWNG